MPKPESLVKRKIKPLLRGFWFLLTFAAPDARRRFGSGFFHAPDLPFSFRFIGVLGLSNTLHHFGGKTP